MNKKKLIRNNSVEEISKIRDNYEENDNLATFVDIVKEGEQVN